MTRFSPEEAGEKAVARRLWLLSSKKYFVINDLLFEKANGNTTQIDHVVVSPYGVFVIETKNISGYIYGSENSSTWTRHWKGYAPGGVYKQDTRTFDNPIHQNEAHVKALAQVLGADIKFVSIVAFSGKANLLINDTCSHVVYWSHVRRVIKSYTNPVMSVEQAQAIYKKLLTINIQDRNTRKSHANRAQINKDNYRQREIESLGNNRCPKCGGHLVKRTGTYGAFYGCSNYPKCKYTHPAY